MNDKSNGRPTAYRPEYDDLAYNYCLLGAKDTQLADFFGVTEQTINNWKKDHPSFFESLKKGKVQADAEVANALFNRAKGYSVTEEREEETVGGEGGGSFKKVKQVKHIAGDTTAQIFWLKNRQPEMWRDKREVDTVDDTPIGKIQIEVVSANNKD